MEKGEKKTREEKREVEPRGEYDSKGHPSAKSWRKRDIASGKFQGSHYGENVLSWERDSRQRDEG